MSRNAQTVALLVRIPARLHHLAKLAAVRQHISLVQLVTEALTKHLRSLPAKGGGK